MLGNEVADALAKEGASKEQTDKSTNLQEARTIIKAKQHSRWKERHPRYSSRDPYYQLTRAEQVVIFRLRTGHNRLNYHMYNKFKIGESGQCQCQNDNMTTYHLLQECPLHSALRQNIWEDPKTVD